MCCRVARVETARRDERDAARAHHAAALAAPRAARAAPLCQPQVARAGPPALSSRSGLVTTYIIHLHRSNFSN